MGVGGQRRGETSAAAADDQEVDLVIPGFALVCGRHALRQPHRVWLGAAIPAQRDDRRPEAFVDPVPSAV